MYNIIFINYDVVFLSFFMFFKGHWGKITQMLRAASMLNEPIIENAHSDPVVPGLVYVTNEYPEHTHLYI